MDDEKLDVESIALELLSLLIENKQGILDYDLDRVVKAYAYLKKKLKEELAKS
jgi:hypothetical protein